MKLLRSIHMWLHVRFAGHYPIGTLVRFRPVGDSLGGLYWPHRGEPAERSMGIVVGAWRANKHPFPPGMLLKGSIVLIDGKPRELDNWDLEAVEL